MTSRLKQQRNPRNAPTSVAPQPAKRPSRSVRFATGNSWLTEHRGELGPLLESALPPAAARCGRLPERKQQRLPTELFQLPPHW